MSVAVIIVTYNRKEELAKALRAITEQICQIDKLYIIDNHSTDGTQEYVKLLGLVNDDWIEYICLPDNIGGAGGFYEGLRAAHLNSYDYYILMDDDGRPVNKDSFSLLIEMAEKLKRFGHKKIMINSVVTYDDNHEELSFGLNQIKTYSELKKNTVDGLYQGFVNPFNGTLIAKALVDEIGYPNKDFFIRGDEVDYQERAKRAGAYLATVIDSLYYHPTCELKMVKWRKRIIYVGICNAWKSYYLIRNYVYRCKRDSGLVAAIKEYLFQTYCARKCNPEYKQCMPFMRKGLQDGLRGRLGRVIEPGQTKLTRDDQ